MLNKKNCKKYIIHNIFVTNPKQYVITGKQKNNFNGKFKLEPVKTYHVGFVVKVLQNLVNIAFLTNFFFQHSTNKNFGEVEFYF